MASTSPVAPPQTSPARILSVFLFLVVLFRLGRFAVVGLGCRFAWHIEHPGLAITRLGAGHIQWPELRAGVSYLSKGQQTGNTTERHQRSSTPTQSRHLRVLALSYWTGPQGRLGGNR